MGPLRGRTRLHGNDMNGQETFDAMVREHMWPFLRVRGFKRSKYNFHRQVESNWQVINLQKSTSSDANHVRFTVNLGVGIDALRRGVHDWAPSARPREPQCHLRQRIGFLLRQEDTWWNIDPSTDVATFADSLNTAIDRYALPFFDAHATTEKLRALARDPAALRVEGRGDLYWLAEFMDQLGEHDAKHTVDAERA